MSADVILDPSSNNLTIAIASPPYPAWSETDLAGTAAAVQRGAGLCTASAHRARRLRRARGAMARDVRAAYDQAAAGAPGRQGGQSGRRKPRGDENAHAPDERLDLGNFHNGMVATVHFYQEIEGLR